MIDSGTPKNVIRSLPVIIGNGLCTRKAPTVSTPRPNTNVAMATRTWRRQDLDIAIPVVMFVSVGGASGGSGSSRYSLGRNKDQGLERFRPTSAVSGAWKR